MEASFWIKSWNLGGFYTSFHRRDVHPFVLTHMTPDAIDGTRILVPLCGKTVDMMYLSQYAQQVIGVELVEEGILQFFQENNLTYRQPDAETYVAGNITILRKDFMALQPHDIGRVDWILDRASLVALPDAMRIDYIKAIDRLSDVGTKQLVITLEYFPLINSAPFSITPDEVGVYYGTGHFIKHVEATHQPNHGMVRKWKLDYLIEHGFVLDKFANGVVLTSAEEFMAYPAVSL
jgi:thiopurine S-methyltransferase